MLTLSRPALAKSPVRGLARFDTMGRIWQAGLAMRQVLARTGRACVDGNAGSAPAPREGTRVLSEQQDAP
jgi:hypothetical protein